MEASPRSPSYPKYKYLPLETPSHTRLVQVHTSERFYDPIVVSFSTIDLCDIDFSPPAFEYQTLSYAWGRTFADGSHLTHAVFCEGTEIRITGTAHDFLRRFRSKIDPNSSISTPTWIDALSINQNDHRERAGQMALMPKIYEHSVGLIIWLGESGVEFQIGWKSAIKSFSTFSGMKDHFGRYIDVLDDPKFEDRRAPQIKDFLPHPWFRCRWAVQEVMHSIEEKVFWFRGSEITWENFLAGLATENVKSSDLPAILKKGASTSMQENKTCSLLRNLWIWDKATCADPRDRIHALISISSDADLYRVNYTNSTETVYKQVAQQIVQSGNGHFVCALLVCAIVHARASPTKALPSWVPDWRTPILADSDGERDCLRICFDGEGPYEDSPFKLNAGFEHRQLQLKGWLFPVCRAVIAGYSCDGRCGGGRDKYGSSDCKFSLAQSHIWKGFESRNLLSYKQTLCFLKDSPIAFALSGDENDRAPGYDETNFQLDTCFPMRSGWKLDPNMLGEPTRFVIV